MASTEPQNGWDTLLAFHVSAMNGIATLAATLRGAGILNDAAVSEMHTVMSHPLTQLERDGNGYVIEMQRTLDNIFAAVKAAPEVIRREEGE
ncbi:hypothetical protein [uncultured Sphingomonas sp.]|uniref:hypothetical protein n=1 Tax=uncultured Sphingomonas sp. TaxID=158754 RepID=UPI002623C6B8|nr:hypothetical protein [uncultured Sphingomonas sp.]